jgi:hypothetical protein
MAGAIVTFVAFGKVAVAIHLSFLKTDKTISMQTHQGGISGRLIETIVTTCLDSASLGKAREVTGRNG